MNEDFTMSTTMNSEPETSQNFKSNRGRRATAVRRVLKLASVLAVGAAAGFVAAQTANINVAGGVPEALTYEGYLEQGNVPVDGIRNMTFRLYDRETGGTPTWTSSTRRAVTVTAGHFAVVLGDRSQPFETALTADLLTSGAVWLEVAVQVPNTATDEIIGRQRLTSAPYALRAADSAALAAPGAPISNRTTIAPNGDLEVAGNVISVPNVEAIGASVQFFWDNTAWVDVPAMTVTITTHGNPVLLIVNNNFNALTAVGPSGFATGAALTIERDGENLGHDTYGCQVASGAIQDNIPVAFTFYDAPSAGIHVYKLRTRALETSVSYVLGEGSQPQRFIVTELN